MCLRYDLPRIVNTTSSNIINKNFTHSFDVSLKNTRMFVNAWLPIDYS